MGSATFSVVDALSAGRHEVGMKLELASATRRNLSTIDFELVTLLRVG